MILKLAAIKALILILLFPFSVMAASCENIRLDRQGFSGQELEVKSQSDSGLCYAFTASYLIDFMKIRNGQSPEFQSSPIAISADYKKSGLLGGIFRGRSLNGGFTCKAIKASKKVYSNKVGSKIFKNRLFTAFSKESKSLYKKYKKDKLSNIELSNFLKKFFYDIDYVELKEGLSSRKKFLQHLVKNISRHYGAEEENSLSCDSIRVKKDTNFSSIINNELSNGKAVGIEYCSRVLYPKSAKKKKCGGHASVVMGQRMKGGSCQVLIQNSWGKTCAPYELDCENGKIWIDRSKLKEEMMAIVKVGN